MPQKNITKKRYADIFGLPAEQIRFFNELTDAQIDKVRQYFTAGLINVDKYVYAIKRDGSLVPRRERRNHLLERTGA